MTKPSSSEETPINRVLVIRPLRESFDMDRVVEDWRNEQVVNAQFAPFTIPQSLVIAEGPNKMSAAIKIAPEVEGVTLKESSLLTILANPEVLEQYIRFCEKVIEVFVAEGKLVDTSGHLARNLKEHLLIGMLPLLSDNLMIEYGSHRLVFIDCDVKPTIHFFERADLKQKIGMLARYWVIMRSLPLAKFFILGNRLRTRVFGEKYQKGVKNKTHSNEEQENFTQGLRQIIDSLKAAKIDFRVIGSIAIAATVKAKGGEFNLRPRRINRTKRDVDIVVLDSDPQKIEEARALAASLNRETKNKKGFPEITLKTPLMPGEELPADEKHFYDWILPTEITRVGIDEDGDVCLIYKEIKTKIPRTLLRPVMITWEGVEIPSVEAGVLAGFALTRGGNFKLKDLRKIKILHQRTSFRIPKEFRNFAQEIRLKYPGLYRNYTLREWLNYWSGGFVSGGKLTALIRDLVITS